MKKNEFSAFNVTPKRDESNTASAQYNILYLLRCYGRVSWYLLADCVWRPVIWARDFFFGETWEFSPNINLACLPSLRVPVRRLNSRRSPAESFLVWKECLRDLNYWQLRYVSVTCFTASPSKYTKCKQIWNCGVQIIFVIEKVINYKKIIY